MDDLIGTQTPLLRIADAAGALRALEEAAPAIADLKRPAPAGVDWPAVEQALGTALPADFKLLTEQYPSLIVGGTLFVGSPQVGAEHSWVDATLEELEIVEQWCEDANLAVRLQPFPALGGLLPWGSTDWGDYLLWSTTGADPSDWTVTVATRNGAWWHYEGGMVQFLAEIIDGTLEQWALHTIRPEVTG
ncbi:SMI1/KNR4 family protein [Streptomyces sp. TLI_171]|uniref:SMI1/KNR4 family protein n=1 Tax=Streptomyces sp. TLI_171 TaxID=1938859 RepID=UPI000C1934CC|nr:SMI1/KNR4 family protein [Streptomyces sp. TLI_171]RKE05040.1 hypothetical protein BX266_7286 [Streptomyces sp. TLI_171]